VAAQGITARIGRMIEQDVGEWICDERVGTEGVVRRNEVERVSRPIPQLGRSWSDQRGSKGNSLPKKKTRALVIGM